jgi:O-antigen/teichoic acid export membrane protein
MRFRIGTKDVLWNYLASILQVVVSLLTLPVVLRSLGSEEMGLWYAFQNFAAFIVIFGNGFVPTIMRSVSYIYSGAQALQKEGVARSPDGKEPREAVNWDLLSDVLVTCRVIYGFIAGFLAVVLASVGTLYIFGISKTVPVAVTAPAWILFVVSFGVNVFYSYYSAFLRGSGRITQANKVIVYSKLVNLVTTYLFLGLGWGLIGVSASFLVSVVVLRIFSVRYFATREVKERLREAARGRRGDWKKTFRLLWHNSYRSGLVSLGAFFVSKSSIIASSLFLGLTMTARLGLTQQVFGIVTALSTVVMNTYLPRFNQLEQMGDTATIRTLFSKTVVFSLLMYAAGTVAALVGGNWILGLIGSKTSLLDRGAMAFLGLVLALEMNHSLYAQLITARNEVPFVVPALVSGAAMVAISFALLKGTTLGVWAVLLAQFVSQAAYNNWKWPSVVMRNLQTRFGTFLREGTVALWRAGVVRLRSISARKAG